MPKKRQSSHIMTVQTPSAVKTSKDKKTRKEQVRRAMLQKMPKGGVCVEVGVWRGEFTATLLEVLQPARLTLIDPWKNFAERTDAFDGQTEDQKFEGIYQDILHRFAPRIESGQIEVNRALSDAAFKTMQADSLDFAYLDGDHSYDGIRADLEAVLPLMKVGGVIMMDDYHRRGWWGDAVIRAAHDFLGAHSANLQIHSMQGAQLALARV